MLIRLKQRKKIKLTTKLNHNNLFDVSCSQGHLFPPLRVNKEGQRRGHEDKVAFC